MNLKSYQNHKSCSESECFERHPLPRLGLPNVSRTSEDIPVVVSASLIFLEEESLCNCFSLLVLRHLKEIIFIAG